MGELSQLSFVAHHDLDRYTAAITDHFPDAFVSAVAVERDVLFERRLNGAACAGDDFDAARLLGQLRALVPERVLRDARWRPFAIFLVSYTCHLSGATDANVVLLVLLVLALAPEQVKSEDPSVTPAPAIRQERLVFLFQLLSDLFTTDELQRFVLFHNSRGTEIVRAIPTDGGHSNYVFAMLEALLRHGWIDEALFDELIRARPAQVARINRVKVTVLAENETSRR